MGNIFSQNQRLEITESDRAVLTLKTQRRRIEDQRKRLGTLIERELTVARTLLAQGRKDRARLALRKKRLQEAQLDRLDGWLLNVEEMLLSVESAQRSAKIFTALKQGNDALKQLQAEMPLEDVEKLMSETAEAAEYEAAVKQLLGQSWTEADEEAADRELRDIEAELLAAEVLEMPSAPSVPAVEEAAAPGRVPAAAAEGAAAAAEALPSAPTHAAVAAQPARQRQLEEPLLAS